MAVSLKQQQIVLELLRDGESLTKACVAADIPNHGRWFDEMEGNEALRDDYARARASGFQLIADRLRILAADQDIPVNDRRLMVDTDKWLLSKCLPKVYGDRLTLDGKLTTKGDELSDEQLQAIIAAKAK